MILVNERLYISIRNEAFRKLVTADNLEYCNTRKIVLHKQYTVR